VFELDKNRDQYIYHIYTAKAAKGQEVKIHKDDIYTIYKRNEVWSLEFNDSID